MGVYVWMCVGGWVWVIRWRQQSASVRLQPHPHMAYPPHAHQPTHSSSYNTYTLSQYAHQHMHMTKVACTMQHVIGRHVLGHLHISDDASYVAAASQPGQGPAPPLHTKYRDRCIVSVSCRGHRHRHTHTLRPRHIHKSVPHRSYKHRHRHRHPHLRAPLAIHPP